MNMKKILKYIDNKYKKLKIYKVFDLFVRCCFTLGGTVFLISVLMFLNSRFGVSYLSCLFLTCVIPSLYSLFVNYSLENFDNKIKKLEFELLELENAFEREIEKLDIKKGLNSSVIKKIELRFDELSNERKLELLNYISDMISNSSYSKYMSDLDNLECLSFDDIGIGSYSRKRKK